MNFYCLVVIALIIYQVGYVRPNQVPAPQQPPCVIGQYPPTQQVPLVPVQPQPSHVPQQWSQQPCNTLQQPPCAMGQQPPSQQVPSIPVQLQPPHVQQQWLQQPPCATGQHPQPPQVPPIPVQPQQPQVQQQWLQQPPCAVGQQPPPQQMPPVSVQPQALPYLPPNTGQQLQQQCVPQQWPPQPWPQQPCNTLQQPPSGPQNPGLTYPPQTGANYLGQQGMLPQPPYPPQYPQPYPPPSGYSQPPVVYPGGCYPPVLGAYPGVYPVYPAGCCYPILYGPSQIMPPVDKRRALVWCTCTKCKEVVPIVLEGNTTQTAVFGKREYPDGEPRVPFSKRTKKCNRPTVKIELCKHKSPCNIVRKILMTTF